MGLFGKIAAAKTMNSGTYLKPGHYLARIDAVKLAKNRKQADYVAIEMTCLHTFPDSEKPADGTESHRPGDSMSDVMTSTNDLFLSKVKTFVAKTLHVRDEEVTEREADLVMSDAQPLKG